MYICQYTKKESIYSCELLNRLEGSPEETITKENKEISHTRAMLQQRRPEPEASINSSIQEQIGMHNIKISFELMQKNLTDLSLESKCLVLGALNIAV